jgi:hypothetical protein
MDEAAQEKENGGGGVPVGSGAALTEAGDDQVVHKQGAKGRPTRGVTSQYSGAV